eukprot:TRINITY_DN12303_c0_g1_i1.p1 TRINITY_DN12303_c0_g1~~TRINITY_DN12303_c0_g1_i1.p1  ORF type:complete len:277 (-),score=48.65 TRINITY_DN12303_c0_g1_i1:158-907(-)
MQETQADIGETFDFDTTDLLDENNFNSAAQLVANLNSGEDWTSSGVEHMEGVQTDANQELASSGANYEFITDLANSLNSIYATRLTHSSSSIESSDDTHYTHFANQPSNVHVNVSGNYDTSPNVTEKYLGTYSTQLETYGYNSDAQLIPGGDVVISRPSSHGFDKLIVQAQTSSGDFEKIGTIPHAIAIWLTALLASPRVKTVALLPNDLDDELAITIKFYILVHQGAHENSIRKRRTKCVTKISLNLE